ncbi:hypothetical protein [Sphingomonas sp. KC8]|uniref:hypothetical protein n=1 Tax=Sphingomonas sp. KC8 TaxID=1030157 RepID=UPI0002489FD2|nr:hypothetical protein [Sphingomonas sp. KC8]ARS27874.1 hypothetical protein KC8_11325 [Sphingomonas sp. KC8]
MILAPLLFLAATAPASASDFARQGGFAIQQIATADAAGLLRDWAAPNRAKDSPIVDTIAREQVVDNFIVFTGCRADVVRRCNVTANFTLVGPQGQIYAEHSGADVWVGKPPPAGGALTLSNASLGIFIEPEDPAGDYVVRADVTDHIAGITLHTEKTLTVR